MSDRLDIAGRRGAQAPAGPVASRAAHEGAWLSKRGAARWRSGHPWIFRDDLMPFSAANGEMVEVRTNVGEPLGWAFYSAASKIALRRFSGPGPKPGLEEILARIDVALAARRATDPGANAQRLISSDADGLPGLVVDRYADHLVIQSLTGGMERNLEAIADRLELLTTPASILLRADAAVRKLEGLPIEVRQLRGTIPSWIEYEDGGLVLGVDPLGGQKTGSFLDQRENRPAAARYLRGRVMDAFCYDGGFGLHAARGADTVVGIDSSESALERARRNAERNGLTNVTWVRANLFDHLREASAGGERYDGIVLDPPAFAKSRADLAPAIRAYKEINLRAMRLLVPGGILVTCSCSYNLGEQAFVDVVADASADARRRAIIIEKRMQARDHPVLLGLPESHYLKCLILKIA